MPPEILIIGEPMVELCAAELGSLRTVRHYLVNCGGDALNVATAVCRLGGRAGLVSRVGSDEFGRLLLDFGSAEGIDMTHVITEPEGVTGIYFVARDRDQHFFTYYRKNSAASHLSPEDVPEELVARARLVHVSGITQAISEFARATVSHAVEAARRARVLLSYDPNVRLKLWKDRDQPRPLMLETVARADIVFASYDDGQFLTQLDCPDEIAMQLLNLGPRAVALKLGQKGALLATHDGIRRFAPWPVPCVDTTGAGDTFAGAFLARWVEGCSLEDCASFANAAAALSITKYGAVAGIPRRADVDALLKGEA